MPDNSRASQDWRLTNGLAVYAGRLRTATTRMPSCVSAHPAHQGFSRLHAQQFIRGHLSIRQNDISRSVFCSPANSTSSKIPSLRAKILPAQRAECEVLSRCVSRRWPSGSGGLGPLRPHSHRSDQRADDGRIPGGLGKKGWVRSIPYRNR